MILIANVSIMPTRELPPFLRLPTELHLQILNYVRQSPWSIISIRCTNRFLRSLTPPLTYDELMECENVYAIENGLRACRYCLFMRPKEHFAKKMLNPNRRYKRFCLDCGFARYYHPGKRIDGMRYMRGTEVRVLGKRWNRWVWCMYCGKLKKGFAAGARVHPGACEKCCEEEKCGRGDDCRWYGYPKWGR